MKTCKDCRFWVEQDIKGPKQNNGVLRGECHCNPPIATGCFLPKLNMISSTVEPQLIETTIWPCTPADYWCGKWEARKKPVRASENLRGKIKIKPDFNMGEPTRPSPERG